MRWGICREKISTKTTQATFSQRARRTTGPTVTRHPATTTSGPSHKEAAVFNQRTWKSANPVSITAIGVVTRRADFQDAGIGAISSRAMGKTRRGSGGIATSKASECCKETHDQRVLNS